MARIENTKLNWDQISFEMGKVLIDGKVYGTEEEFYSAIDSGEIQMDDDESDEYEPYEMTDTEADADTLRSAGYGTDEDYGYYGDDFDEMGYDAYGQYDENLSLSKIYANLKEVANRKPTPQQMFSELKKGFKSRGFVVTSSEKTWAELKCWMKSNIRFSANGLFDIASEILPTCNWRPSVQVGIDDEDKIIGVECSGIEIEKHGSEVYISVRTKASSGIPTSKDPSDL